MEFRGAVLQVIPELDTGGAERTTIDVARAIVEAGGRAVVASAGGRMVEELEETGAIFRQMPLASKNPFKMWGNRGRLKRLIDEFDINIVHARSRAPAWSALWAARAKKRAFVTTYHGHYSGKTKLKKFYNSVMARGDVVIANSEFTRAHILDTHKKVSADKVIAVPRGVDLAVFNQQALTDERIIAIQEAWGMPGGDPRIIVLLPGRLTAWKGQSVAIDAAKALKNAGQEDDFLFILAGDAQGRGGYEKSLEAAIASGGLGDMVRLVGHCYDMAAAYAVSDIVLSTSTRPEAFGRIAAEAQAMGRPVIASDHGGARETVEQDVTGWRTPPGDADALATALATFARMSQMGRNYMGREAAAHIAEKFSVEAMCRETLKAYRKALNG